MDLSILRKNVSKVKIVMIPPDYNIYYYTKSFLKIFFINACVKRKIYHFLKDYAEEK